MKHDKLCEKMEQKNLKLFNSISLNLNYKDLIIFLIPCIIFLYYLYIFDPGILRYDSYNQLNQIATNSYNNWHPFFHTFIYQIWLKIYPDIKILSIIQILIFSTIWMVICKYYRPNDLNSNKIFILQLLITLVISLIPINAIYSITLLKDTLFSYLMLFLSFLIAVLLDKKCVVNIPFIIILSLTMACVTQIRHNGLILIIIFLIALGIYFYKTHKATKIFLFISVLTILFIIMISSLNVVYDVADTPKDAICAKVEHMLADYDLNLDLNKGDRDKIYKIVDKKTIKKEYEITSSDSIYFNSHPPVYEKDKETYIWMAIKYSLKNPKHFIKYLFYSSPIVWDITRDSWTGFAYSTDTNGSRDVYYNYSIKKGITPTNYIDKKNKKNTQTQEYKNLNSFVNTARDNKITDTIFYSPALYMFLAFLSMILIHWITKSKEVYLVYLPNMINIIVIFLSIPTQDNRYLYPNLLVFYLLIIMLISLILKNKDKIFTKLGNNSIF